MGISKDGYEKLKELKKDGYGYLVCDGEGELTAFKTRPRLDVFHLWVSYGKTERIYQTKGLQADFAEFVKGYPISITDLIKEYDSEDEPTALAFTDSDPVNHPSHYNQGGIETLDIIKMSLTEEEYRGYLKGNVLKYRERSQFKGNPEQDYAKAKFYFEELEEQK